MYINDLVNYLDAPNSGITIAHVKTLLLLYADDVIFAESAELLQVEIDKLVLYCTR